ncbi:MAG: hypothetical protein U9P14_11430 [Gemmatimonadota bacterium]|nr:hypothetical protein [Gemmatimonadota bacterium]
MRVLPYFQTAMPGKNIAPGRARARTGAVEQQAAPAAAVSKVAGSVRQARPLEPKGRDTFVPTSLATAVVHSIVPEPAAGISLIGPGSGSAETSSGIVKSGYYSLYRLNGSLDSKYNTSRGENLDLRG